MPALNKGLARIDSVSCSSPGYCSAGGFYDGRINNYGQPFVVNEVNGTWHKAIPVPGILALNTGKNGFVSSVSCTRPGDCSAGGRYGSPKQVRAFVVDEVNGVWHKPIALAVSGSADVEVSALACASPGNCSAGGTNSDLGSSAGLDGTFVVNEVNGRWGRPIEIPGKFSWVYGAWVKSMSCPSAGNCTAGGWYSDSLEQSQAFVVSEVNGHWHSYITVPGTSAFSPGHGAQVSSLSCPRPGNCTVAGNYIGAAGFLASEVNGHWHNATPVPGLTNLYASETGQVTVLSCATAGNCSAGGAGLDAGTEKGFVINEVNGIWHNAIDVPGMPGLGPSGNGQVIVLSCPAAGNCTAGGFYGDRSGASQGFVVNEVNGIWHNAIEVPGMSTLNPSRNGQVTALSCAKAGKCSAGGTYAAPKYTIYSGQVFAVSEG